AALQERIEQLLRRRDHTDHESVRAALEGEKVQAKPDQLAPLKKEMLGAIAEAQFLRRALPTVSDPAQHAVTVEILRVGRARALGRMNPNDSDPGGFFHAMLTFFTALDVEAWASRDGNDRIFEGTQAGKLDFHTSEQVVLQISDTAIALQ